MAFEVVTEDEAVILRAADQEVFSNWLILNRASEHPLPPEQPGAPDHLKYLDALERLGSDTLFDFGILTLGELVGLTDLSIEDEKDSTSAYIGYEVAKPFQRNGYATLALKAMCHLTLYSHGIDDLRLVIAPHNAASERVASKAGFVIKGIEGDSNLWVRAQTNEEL